VELAIINQLLEDEDALRLVDEMFFEFHIDECIAVDNPVMYFYWGEVAEDGIKVKMADAYRISAALRAKGVRMHSRV
jgi:hypothetical protein